MWRTICWRNRRDDIASVGHEATISHAPTIVTVSDLVNTPHETHRRVPNFTGHVYIQQCYYCTVQQGHLRAYLIRQAIDEWMDMRRGSHSNLRKGITRLYPHVDVTHVLSLPFSVPRSCHCSTPIASTSESPLFEQTRIQGVITIVRYVEESPKCL